MSRKNPAHKKEYSHPGDSDWESESERDKRGENTSVADDNADNGEDDDKRPECEFGTGCYRKNPSHLKSFKHTQKKRISKSIVFTNAAVASIEESRRVKLYLVFLLKFLKKLYRKKFWTQIVSTLFLKLL